MWPLSRRRPSTTPSARAATNERDPIAMYLRTLERLRSGRRWGGDSVALHFATLALGEVGSTIGCNRLREVADGLSDGESLTSPLVSAFSYVAAAMILRQRLDPAAIHERVSVTRAKFKARGITGRDTGLTLAALLLAIRANESPVPAGEIGRLALIYGNWKEDHPWLTNSSDLPTAALYSSRYEAVGVLATEAERAFGLLRDAGFWWWPETQFASQLLAISAQRAEILAERFCLVADRLKSAGLYPFPSRYAGIALLALTRKAPTSVVEPVLEYRDRLRSARPRPPKGYAFSLSAGIELAKHCPRGLERSVLDVFALRSLRQLLAVRWSWLANALFDLSLVRS